MLICFDRRPPQNCYMTVSKGSVLFFAIVSTTDRGDRVPRTQTTTRARYITRAHAIIYPCSSRICGRMVQANYKGKTVRVKIVDRCSKLLRPLGIIPTVDEIISWMRQVRFGLQSFCFWSACRVRTYRCFCSQSELILVDSVQP